MRSCTCTCCILQSLKLVTFVLFQFQATKNCKSDFSFFNMCILSCPSTIVRRRRSPAPPGDGSERPYSCHICTKRFRRAETLRRHNRVHTGEKPHACDVCGKMFREPFHLTKHLTVHSGQKNYKCNLCGKMFAYAQSLVRHGKLHRRGEIDNQGRRIKGKT